MRNLTSSAFSTLFVTSPGISDFRRNSGAIYLPGSNDFHGVYLLNFTPGFVLAERGMSQF